MCGIAGIYQPNHNSINPDFIRNMLTQIQYRGPDEAGIYMGQGVGLGSVRLSIIDIEQGQQPMSTQDEELWIAYNGEIFNYIELRRELIDLGYSFKTSSDTEVLLLLFKHYREKCLNKLNGQFAFAIWDAQKKELFLARDRMGIRPLYFYSTRNGIVFGSEIKCIFESGLVAPELDSERLNQAFTFWSVPSPGSLFKGVNEIPPGHYMILGKGEPIIKAYWDLKFSTPEQTMHTSFSEASEEFEGLLSDSVKLRLRSDVQVAAYLSGGLDSSATTHYIKKAEPGVLNTFSIGFEDSEFDETPFQESVSKSLGTSHYSISCKNGDIAMNFAKVLWHTETPIFRTGAVPMFMLSNFVHEHGIKVVITGEGADEFLGGYNIFKEALVREFWSRQPDSKIRPLLLQKLYPYLAQFQGRNRNMLKFFYGHGLTDTDSPIYSHLIRWNNTKHIREHFSDGFSNSLESDPIGDLLEGLPSGFNELDLLSRAQWIESKLFLSGYLLSSQGDRMSMAHSLEGRYPFLDHRVIEFCTKLQSNHKIKGLNEKYLLKQMMKGKLPDPVVNRPKQAYRAPVATSLISPEAPEYLREVMSAESLNKNGIFDVQSVEKLIGNMGARKTITENENMAIAGILSTQILMDLFMNGNNPFKESKMRVKCPVIYDKKLKVG